MFGIHRLLGCGSDDPASASNAAGEFVESAPAASTAMAAVAPALDPGQKDMHRLNTAEYNATVADVLGTTLQPADGNWRGGELAGFDNIASVLGVDAAQYERYFAAADALAREVVASDELLARFVSCDLGDPACVSSAIERAGLGLFRRPLTPDEVTTYQRVHDTAIELGDPPESAFELTLRALLSSAEFLFRIEFDPDPQSLEPHPLDGFELATRLSYFLWSSAPDEELLVAARDGSLLQSTTLSRAVDRLLDDPRAERFVSNFAGQWLGARGVVSHPVDVTLHGWSPHLARAAANEILLYFSEFLRTERSWFEFPTADINYVDDWLAALYGMPTPAEFPARVEFAGDARHGFFGLAGFLAITSFDRRTSPSLRGRWIASNLLCLTPPDPPPDVPEFDVTGQDSSALSVRNLLEQHSRNPECAVCHALFDPYGLALEEYDPIGKYRSSYADGTPVDASAALSPSPQHPQGQHFEGLDGLARVIASEPRFGACLAEKLLIYGLGRPIAASDRPHLDRVAEVWAAPSEVPSLRRMVRTLVLSEPFRFRRGGQPSPAP